MVNNVDWRLLEQRQKEESRIAQLEVESKKLKTGGGDGNDQGMEARVAVLEQIAKDTRDVLTEIKGDIREIRQDQKTDFRVLFGALIAATLGLAGLMAHGFHWF